MAKLLRNVAMSLLVVATLAAVGAAGLLLRRIHVERQVRRVVHESGGEVASKSRRWFGNIEVVTGVRFDGCSPSEGAIRVLAQSPDIYYVSLRNMELSDSDLGALLAFPNLRNLDLSDSSSSETGFAQLTRLSTLRAVQLRNVSASDELIAKVLDANPQLTAVIVDNTYAAELTARSLLRLQQLEAVSVVDTGIPAPYLDTYRSQGVSVFTAWANTAEQQRALCPRKRKEEDQDLSHVTLH